MKFIILGSGSSMGVPRPDGSFGNCDPKNPKNLRSRCSAFIKSSDMNILIDTSPDLRSQMLKNKIKIPMNKKARSLNVAMSVAIVAAEALRQNNLLK